MNPAIVQLLSRYHFATTERLLDCAAKIDDAAYRAPSIYNERSIHQVFHHLLQVSRSWRIALETGSQPAALDPDDTTTIDALRDTFAAERDAWAAQLGALDDAAVDADVTVKSQRFPEPWTLPRWRPIVQVILHGMQHHSEIAQALTLAGQSPGNIDMIFFE